MPYFQMFRIGDVDYSAQYLAADARGQLVLRDARALKVPVTCLCNLAVALRFAIKRQGEGPYFLARHPNTGQEHDTCCPSYESPGKAAERKRARQGVAAVVEANGQFYVNLQEPLAGATPNENPGPMRLHGAGEGERKASTTLTGLSLFLFEQGGLTKRRFGPKSDNWNDATSRIAKTILPNTWLRGQAATEVVLLPRLSNSEEIYRRVEQLRAAWDRYEKPYKLVFGDLTAVRALGQERVVLRLDGSRMEIVMPKSRWEAALRCSVSANAAAAVRALGAANPNSRVVCMALVKAGNGEKQVLGITAAVVATHRTFMPVASQPELAVANRLFDGAGHIDKPMRPHPECLPYVPDFVLTLPDKRKLFMEVAGLNDVGYLEHLRRKVVAYDGYGLALWVWFVGAEPMPAFTPQSFAAVSARLDTLLTAARGRVAGAAASGSDAEAG